MKILAIKVWLFSLAILFFIIGCQKNQPPVARINDSEISVREFGELIQFNPNFSAIRDERLLKRKMLATLVAVKLLTTDEAGITSLNDKQQMMLEQLGREAEIEAFWDNEIYKKIKISEQELKEAYFKSKESRIIRYLIYQDRNSADNDYRKLNSEATFEQIAETKGYHPGEIPVDTLRWENKLPHLEPVAFDLKRREISTPVKEGKFYFILQLIAIKRDIFTTEDDFNQHKAKLIKQAKNVKAIGEFEKRFAEYRKNNQYNLQKAVFRELVKILDHEIFDASLLQNDSLDIWGLKYSDVLQSHLKSTVVTFSSGAIWNIEMLLERIAVSPYKVQVDKGRGAFRTSMIGVTRQTLDDALLAQYAVELGLQNDLRVKQDVGMWRDYFRYTENLKSILQNKTLNELEDELLTRLDRADWQINFSILDTLSIERTDMVALKRHFPGRSITPLFHPLPPMPKFEQVILSGRK